MSSGSSAKSIPFETESLRTKTCLSLDRIDYAIKPRECIGNDIVFTRNKVYIWVEFFNIIEPANDAVQGSIVSGYVKMISVYVWHCSQEHGAKFGSDHDNGE